MVMVRDTRFLSRVSQFMSGLFQLRSLFSPKKIVRRATSSSVVITSTRSPMDRVSSGPGIDTSSPCHMRDITKLVVTSLCMSRSVSPPMPGFVSMKLGHIRIVRLTLVVWLVIRFACYEFPYQGECYDYTHHSKRICHGAAEGRPPRLVGRAD